MIHKDQQYTLELGDPIGKPAEESNQMVRVYGRGPDGRSCRTCKYLNVSERAPVHFKCDFREDSNGVKAIHKPHWNTCGKYVSV